MSGKKAAFTDAENEVLRGRLREYRQERGLTQREMGELLGIEQQNIGRLESKARTGLNRTTANALAHLLKYRDVEELLLAEGVLAELRAPPPRHSSTGAGWSDRDMAVKIAASMKIDPVAVQAVVARFTEDSHRHKPIKWWVTKFGNEEIERAAERIAAPPDSRPAPRDVPMPKAPAAPAASPPAKRRAHG